MRITFNQKDLKDSLADILAIVHESSLTQLSRALKLETDHDVVHAYLGNGETYIKQAIPGTVILPGTCILNGNYLHELVKNLSSAELVELIFEQNRLVVKQRGLRYKIPTILPDNFWQFQPVGEDEYTAINPEALVECIGAVTYAISKDTPKPMANILIEPSANGKIRAVGCDGIRLALHNAIGVVNRSMLLSASNAKALKKYLSDKEELAMFADGSLVHLLTPSGFLKMRSSSQTYVDYRSAIPQGPYKSIAFKTEDLRLTLMRTLLFKSDNPIITMEVSPDVLRIELINKEGEGLETLGIESDIKDPISICINPRYLMEILEHMKDAPLKIRYYGKDRPLVITDDVDSLTLLTQVSTK